MKVLGYLWFHRAQFGTSTGPVWNAQWVKNRDCLANKCPEPQILEMAFEGTWHLRAMCMCMRVWEWGRGRYSRHRGHLSIPYDILGLFYIPIPLLKGVCSTNLSVRPIRMFYWTGKSICKERIWKDLSRCGIQRSEKLTPLKEVILNSLQMNINSLELKSPWMKRPNKSHNRY